ncbi:MAG: DUF262 domain-containing protein [Chitinophagales bacterium]|nr:DUF262 domain-containing protein [Chitinophagales bacterium]
MDAREVKIQPLIDGSRQYLLPLFQRKYVWDKPQWQLLWNNIKELCEDDDMKSHFIGSVVNIPMSSVPHGVAKYVLIDGQQRLTTLFILLIVLRDRATVQENDKLADKINDLVINRHESDNDHYKLLPTEKDNDRKAFISIINSITNTEEENRITKAYSFFEREIRKLNIDVSKVLSVITQRLSLVSIVLNEEDNPHLVFESLNSTGMKLLPSDLIRNYFFMRIHTNDQTANYNKFWSPMETKFKNDKHLTEFIRHYLKKDGSVIKESEIYNKLREKVTDQNAITELQELSLYSTYYYKLLYPSNETNQGIRNFINRLNVLEVTTAYPFLLNCYNDYEQNNLSSEDFIEVLRLLENFLIRRYVANVATNQLDKIFPVLYRQVRESNETNFVAGLKKVLSSKNYPTNIQFRRFIETSKLYGGGDKNKKTKHLLTLIEQSYGHKEIIDFESLSIEHILPKTLSEDWKKYLGDNWEETRDLFLHTIGNLTLTGYNSEMSNDMFEDKKQVLQNSHLALNKYFYDIDYWGQEEIKGRSVHLAEKCILTWPYFGDENISESENSEKKLQRLIIWKQEFPVKYWTDILEITVKTIADLMPEKIELLIKEFPSYVNNSQTKFNKGARIIQITNNVYINKNYSVESIQRFCTQAIETIGMSTDEWQVIVA